MREYSVPALVAQRSTGNLTDLVSDNAAQVPHRILFRRKVEDGWVDVSAEEFAAQVTALAKGLIASGVELGDRVGLMSKTRYEWTLCDFAIWAAGGVTVPIYETSSAEQVVWMLGDSGAVAALLETPAHATLVSAVRGDLDALREVWVFDEGGLDALVAAGTDVADSTVEARRRALTPETLATIIYTSGTTGPPKGCELTHGNFLDDLTNTTEALPELFKDEQAATLLFIPLAHVFARVVQIGCVMSRTCVGHSANVTTLLADLASFRPTFVLAVPRVFEKIFNSSEQKAEAAGKGRIFATAAATAIAYSTALDSGGPGLLLRARHALFDRLVFAKLRAAMGGQAAWAVSGGAPLGDRLGHFFRGVGLTVLEGYGLTETTAAATFNTPRAIRVGSVGRPLPGGAVRIDEDGEVLLTGPHVFRGYYGDPAATAAAFTADGWFRSGDLGELDADGFLRITGRKKEILVTAGGKNVAPAVLEDRLRAHRLISQCMVVGDGKPYVASVITLDSEALGLWLDTRGKPRLSAAEAAEDPDVRAEIQQAVDAANGAVSQAEAIRRFRILPGDFTEEGGQLTPSLKLKRSVVLREFAADVESLYR